VKLRHRKNKSMMFYKFGDKSPKPETVIDAGKDPETAYSIGATVEGTHMTLNLGYSTLTMTRAGAQNLIDQLEVFKSQLYDGDSGYRESTKEKYDEFVKGRNQSGKMLLREFSKQSGLELYGLGKDRLKWESTMEKFSELIVRECIDVVRKATTSPNGYQALMKHFGVEE